MLAELRNGRASLGIGMSTLINRAKGWAAVGGDIEPSCTLEKAHVLDILSLKVRLGWGLSRVIGASGAKLGVPVSMAASGRFWCPDSADTCPATNNCIFVFGYIGT